MLTRCFQKTELCWNIYTSEADILPSFWKFKMHVSHELRESYILTNSDGVLLSSGILMINLLLESMDITTQLLRIAGYLCCPD